LKSSDLIIGRQPLVEALQAGRAIDKILFQRNVNGESIGEIRKLAGKRGIPIQQVPVENAFIYPRNHQEYSPCRNFCLYGPAGGDDEVVSWVRYLFLYSWMELLMLEISVISRSAVRCGAGPGNSG
jgi:hypothetical protein